MGKKNKGKTPAAKNAPSPTKPPAEEAKKEEPAKKEDVTQIADKMADFADDLLGGFESDENDKKPAAKKPEPAKEKKNEDVSKIADQMADFADDLLGGFESDEGDKKPPAKKPEQAKGGKKADAKKDAPKPDPKGAPSGSDTDSLEATLKNQQWLGGQAPTSADKDAFEAICKSGMVNAETHPNTFAWFALVSKFTDKVKATWPAGGAADKGGKGKQKGGKGKEAPKKKEDEVEMDDLFGDDDDDGAAAAAAAKAAKEAKDKKKKKVVIAMSIVMLEVKPLDDTIDLDELHKKILAEINQDGLNWKTEYKKVPVAFGIFKLYMGFSCEDEKTSVDDIVERIEGFEDHVQSVEIASFNKI